MKNECLELIGIPPFLLLRIDHIGLRDMCKLFVDIGEGKVTNAPAKDDGDDDPNKQLETNIHPAYPLAS